MSMKSTSYTDAQYLEFYRKLLLPRMIEERMLISLRQGKISKWFSAWGQEAISVGTTLAMNEDEYMLTMHRNLGVFTATEIPLITLLAQFEGKSEGFTKARDRLFHIRTEYYKIIGMSSHLDSQMERADAMAAADSLHN